MISVQALLEDLSFAKVSIQSVSKEHLGELTYRPIFLPRRCAGSTADPLLLLVIVVIAALTDMSEKTLCIAIRLTTCACHIAIPISSHGPLSPIGKFDLYVLTMQIVDVTVPLASGIKAGSTVRTDECLISIIVVDSHHEIE